MGWAILAAVGFLFVISFIKVLNEYERGAIYRLGRLLPKAKGPGIIVLIPFVDKMQRIDTRVVTLQVPPQEIITRDNVTTRVNAVAYFRVVNSLNAVNEISDYTFATSQIAQTTLRSVLGQHTLDELLSEREKINERLQEIIDSQTESWGVKVGIVEVKDVEIPTEMQRAMAREAEAERERRAKVIAAEGEFQASTKLTEAANVMSTNPITVQLRYLQTLIEIGSQQNTTTVFPLPLEFLEAMGGNRSPAVGSGAPTGV